MVVGRVQVTNKFKPDAAIVKHVNKYAKDLNEKLNHTCGFTDVELECRFDHLRSEETNAANLIADIIYTEYESLDLVMLNTGTLRSNSLVPAGPLKRRFVADMLPVKDKIFLIKMSGKTVKDMFENAVSAYPKLDGRFPAISGCTLTFDAGLEPGKRVIDIRVKDEKLVMEK